jgi:alpha-glucosidase
MTGWLDSALHSCQHPETKKKKSMETRKRHTSQKQVPEWLQSILHSGTKDHVSNPYPKLGETVRITLEIPIEAEPEQVVLRSIPNGEQQLSKMRVTETRGEMQIWAGELLVNEPRVPYRFAIQAEERIWWINALGVSQQAPLGLFDFKLLANIPEISWLSHSVFYQIFPDRFANGDPTNDPAEGELEIYPGVTRKTYQWGEKAPASQDHFPFYGGDLKGIEDKLGYLQDLGINALYLNPIFTADSNHRYDVSDFRNVDPTLGGNDALVSLSGHLKAAGMRYILDIVPNHSGAGHAWFREASRDPQSPRRSAYFFREDDAYASWMGFGSLPKLNYADPGLRGEMYESDNSVFAHWLKPPYKADGWRVDVGNMLGRYNEHQLDGEILPAIRKTVKRASPDSYLIGENFYEAIGQLQGDAWDGVMNYAGFTEPFLGWLKAYKVEALCCDAILKAEQPLSTQAMVASWQTNLAAIPYSIALQQFNLLDSHDTPRIRSILEEDESLIRLAIMVQFTFPGVPCIYYGDEIGLADEEGFAQRNCFPWNRDQWNQDLLNFYKCLIHLRKTSEVLAKGSFQVLSWDDDSFIFQRTFARKRMIVTANRKAADNSYSLKTPLINPPGQTRLRGIFSGQHLILTPGEVKIPALGKGGEIWLEEFDFHGLD